nr:ABC transporter permease [Anaerolineae bacterium]
MINEMLAIAWKDLQLLFKDKGSLAVLFLMPLILAPIMAAPTLTMRE